MPSSGCALSDHDRRDNSVGRRPPELAHHELRDPGFHVERAECLLGVHDGSLDFDDEQNSLDGVPRQEVDAPPIPVVVEADLTADAPTEAVNAAAIEAPNAA